MKKTILALTGLLLSFSMQAQDRPMPKPGPAPAIKVKKPEMFTLPNGLKVMVVENNKLPRVSYSLTIDNAPYAEGNKKGVDDLTSAMIGNGTKNMTKDKFNNEIDMLGADISFYSSGAFASGLSRYKNKILSLMADGALNPLFTQEEFDKEKAKLIEGLKSQEKSVPAVAGRVTNVLAFGKSHPAGEYLTEETINNVTLDDVKQNYATYFVPSNAYLVVLGDVKFNEVKKEVTKLFSSWTRAVAPKVTYNDPANVQYTQINFVDMPNAVQSEIAMVNTVRLEMKDPDYFPVILANQVFGGDFNSYLNMNLREAHGWTYGARSSIGGSRYIQAFRATTQVRNSVTDSAIVESIKELKRIRTEKVTDEMLNNVKAGYIGRFVMQIEKPQTVARYALNIETEKLPADFYENYIRSINAVTPEDVMRVAQKYFQADNMRIVVVGKASEVLPSLEKLGIPIFFFDKFGNPTEKPVMKKPAPAGLTAKTVLESYIKAIGGEKAVKGVKSIATKSTGVVQGANLELETKKTNGKKFMEMKVMGMSMMKQVVTEKSGYAISQGQRKDLSPDELKDEQADAQPFPELGLMNKAGVTLDGIESINGSEAYVVKDGKSTMYFDTKTGLKIAEATTQKNEEGQSVTQTVNFADYKEVKGLKVPHKMSMNVGIDLELTTAEVKINEGVKDADFQ